jgi:hypothetical protein
MAESDSVATWKIAVDRGVWRLPADVAAMVAPPVTVSGFPVADPPPRVARRPVKPAR